MDRTTRWEAAALRSRKGRPRPGTGEPTINLTEPRRAPSAAPPRAPATNVEPDALLVPLDAWNRMLNQLGNLHEAGRELADARERAAKAETEVAFLRERLAESRDRLAAAGEEKRPHPAPTADAESAMPVEPSSAPAGGAARMIAQRSRFLVRSGYAKWRARRRHA